MRDYLSRPWARALGAAAGIYVLFAASSWLAVPWIVRRVLREVPKQLPGFQARVTEARFDPFRLALTVRGFTLSQEKLGELAACDEFYASFQPLDLFRLAIGLRDLRLRRPRLTATISADGTTALSYLPKAATTSADAPSSPAKPPFIPRLIVRRLTIERAALEFESRLASAPQKLAADPINLSLENFSTLPNAEGSYVFTARTDRGESLRWNGRLSVRPLLLTGRAAAEGLDLSREVTAVPSAPVELPKGRLDAAADYSFGYADGVLTASLSGARVGVRDALWSLRGSTAAPRGPFSLEISPIRVELRAPMPTPPGAKVVFNANALVAGRGAVKVDAVVSPTPLSGGARLRVSNLPLTPFTPLAPPPTQIAIDSGAFSMDASVALSSGAGITAQASLSLDEFSLSDLASRRPLVKLRRFEAAEARASLKAKTAEIQRVSLAQPLLRLFRGADGRTNVEAALGISFSSATDDDAPISSTATVASPARPAAPARGEVPWRAKLKRFTMTGGRVIVQDEAVSPPFALTVRDASAELKDLTTDGRSTATFTAKGLIEKAPYAVAGGVRLSSAAAWIDAHMTADGVQLSAFSPYSIQVIGYKLDQGALNLNLTESLAARDILSRNKVVVDQLTLGEKVESPTALKVPVKLGLAILKDRNGVIDLDVPIEGSLDDPRFRLSRVILKTLLNLIVKAATSPFDALSKMLGGGADLGHIPFAAGTSDLEADAPARLDKVAKALVDRPALFVGVRGDAGKADAAALGDVRLRRQLRGGDPGPEPLTQGEEKKVLALHERTFAAPAASVAEARAKLDESMAASPAELRALALARAAAIQDYLTGEGVAPARFFSLEPAADAKSASPAQCELQLEAR